MKKIQFYHKLLFYVLAFILSQGTLLYTMPNAVAATLTATEISDTTYWLGKYRTKDDWDDKDSYYRLVKKWWVDDAWVKYKVNITEPGWYKIYHDKLDGREESRDRNAIYKVVADQEYTIDINQSVLGSNAWRSQDWYCFDRDQDNYFQIESGVYGYYKSEYTYAPKTLTLIKDASRTITSCSEVYYSIRVTLSEYGSVARADQFIATTAGTKIDSILAGNSPTYTFTPNDGYVIKSITVDGEPIPVDEKYKFDEIDSDRTISVVFGVADHKITASVVGNTGGTITPSGVGDSITSTRDVFVADGSSQEFIFTANANYIVSDIIVDNESIINNEGQSRSGFTFSEISEDHTIKVVFSAGYIINATAGFGGTINPEGDVSVASGAEETFDITPNNSCYTVSDVQISEYKDEDGDDEKDFTSKGPISSYTFSNVLKNYAIYAEFNKVDTDIRISSQSSIHADIYPEDKEVAIDCGVDRIYTIKYDEKATDLYVYINDAPIKLLEAGKPLTVPDFMHSVISNDDKYVGAFTFTVSGITEDTVIRLHDIVELADYPLDIVTRPAPPNIMFVLDDSGSMLFEFMTEQDEGKFNGDRYVFKTPGVNESYLYGNEKKRWKGRYFDYNKIYYNPTLVYQPWPNQKQDDISREFKVRVHPVKNTTPNFSLSDQYMEIGSIRIPNAHYFIKRDKDIILVALDYNSKDIMYYKVTKTSGSDSYQNVDMIAHHGTETDDAKFMKEAQNFANWFTFYRNRQLTATSAISRVIDQVSNTYIGILTIQGRIKQAVAPVRVQYLNEDGEFVTEDERSMLFDKLYDLYSNGGTPLRSGLKKVGQYYDQTDRSNGTIEGRNPWFSAEEGGACQQSFAIAMTDGYYNGNLNGVGSVGHVDKNKGKPYADNYSDTLADIAMYYYERDLVSTLGNSVPGEGRQHMKTYGVAFGVEGDLGDPSQYTLVPGCTENCKYPTWPNPTSSKEAKIDDLFHASVNGRGLYLNASDPQELIDSLSDIIVDISDQSGSAASVSVNGDQLYNDASTGELLMYQTQYTSPDWVGKVYAYKVGTDGSVDTQTSEGRAWEASERLDAALKSGADVNDRIIATYKENDGVAFDTLTNLSNAQQEYFEDGYDGTEKEDLFQYIRGSNEKESSTLYRVRNSRLGDIVNSGAHYHEGYVYVGANDGMMHVFDGATGDEKFAYIPSMVLPNLKSLASQTYGDGHRFFVDGTPVVTKVGDKSYLVGGLGKGGKGYYSINVTNAGNIGDSATLARRVLWEYPQANTPDAEWKNDLGNTFSKALTIKSYAAGDTALDGYVTFFGNGYGSTRGKAVLYFLNPETGRLIKKIDVGGTTGLNGMGTPVAVDVNNDNKMDYIYAGDLEGNMWKFDVQDKNPDNWQVAYCEESGNTCKDTDQPRPLVTTADGQAITSSPDITRHPSGTGYMVVFGTGRFLSVSDWDNNTKQSFYGIWDFGDDGDNTEYLGKVQSNGQLKKGNATQTFTLLQQTQVYYGPPLDASGNKIEPEAGSEDVKNVRVLTDHTPNWSQINDPNNKPTPNPEKDPNGHAGWVFNLPLQGERSTVDTIIRDGKAIMVSFILNGDRCAGGADSLIHELDVYTGGRLSKPAFDVNGDGVIDEKDMVRIPDGNGGWIMVPPSALQKPGRLQAPAIVGLGKDSDIEVKHLSSSSGKIETVTETKTGEQPGVYYWREF